MLTKCFNRNIFLNIFRFNAFKSLNRFNSSTIYSVSTNIKDSGSPIAVIRVSGLKSSDVFRHLIKSKSKWKQCLTNARKAVFTQLYDNHSKELLDSSIVIWFPKPNSYTGEDMCELHVHGSHAVISSVLTVLSRIEGFRQSEAGEFTKRALINNKINLIEAEGIRDLITSRTDSQRRRALTAMTGTVDSLYESWRIEIIKLMAHLEAKIDFGDEELINESVLENVNTLLTTLAQNIDNHLINCKNKSDLIKDGLKVTIIGETNAGKSTLINNLCNKDLSIVSPISGTTRDVIETWLNMNGYAVSISDTAGIRDLRHDLQDVIEKEGIIKAIKRAKCSDILIYVIDASDLFGKSDNTIDLNIDRIGPNYIKEILKTSPKVIYLINKIDLLSDKNYNYLHENCYKLNDWHLISCKTLNGFEEFNKKFTKIVEEMCGNPMNEMLFTTNRHEAHLVNVVQQIQLSIETIERDIAISAHHLREGVQHMAHITGKITTDDVLDVIFKDFCIGK